MKATLVAGLTGELHYVVPGAKTVPGLYPEASEFQQMPEVFATGFLVGLLEWACIRVVNPHLDWPEELTLGTHIAVSHSAATPPGLRVVVQVRLTRIEGRRLLFDVEAHDGVDVISQGTHERCVIQRARFDAKMQDKAALRPAAHERPQ